MAPTDSGERTGAAALESAPASTAPAAEAGRGTHAQILKSSVLVGGSSVMEIVIGLVRVKATALMLGPSGFGLIGLYTSILNLAQNIAGMGIKNSGVRQIAAAVGSGDTERIALTSTVLRRVTVVLGLLGAVSLVVLSRPISRLTFNSDEYATPIAFLSLALLLSTLSDGQRALIQGLRRIRDLALTTVLGAFLGTVLGIVVVYFLRERGVVSYLITMAGASLLFSWWFSRRLRFAGRAPSALQVGREAGALLKLGLAFLADGMLIQAAAYAVRIMIVRRAGVEAAGLYQSAWTIGGMYVGFILRAMGTDFYPRLTAAVEDHRECNRLVNEQAEVSLLLAGPGILATLAFTPIVIPLLYSSAFAGAAEILRWICLGGTLQVITWPLGYIIVALGRQQIFFWCDFAYTVIYLFVAWVLVARYGVNGAAMAFFGSYVVHGLIVYPIVHRLTGFRWSAANWRTGGAFLAVIGLAFSAFYFLPWALAIAVGFVALLFNTVYSARVLVRLIPADRLPPLVRRLLVLTRIAPPGDPS